MIHWVIALPWAVEPEAAILPDGHGAADAEADVVAAADVEVEPLVPPVVEAAVLFEEEQPVSEAAAIRPAPVATA